jgi:hypothetical protein
MLIATEMGLSIRGLHSITMGHPSTLPVAVGVASVQQPACTLQSSGPSCSTLCPAYHVEGWSCPVVWCRRLVQACAIPDHLSEQLPCAQSDPAAVAVLACS